MRNILILLFLVFSNVCLSAEAYNTNGWVDDPAARIAYQSSPEHQLLRTKLTKVVSLYKDEEGSALLYRALYQLKKELGELSDLEKQTGRLDAENQGSLGSCFLKDTMVTMADGGHKAIQNIKVGDLVLSGQNNFRKVNEIFKFQYVGEITTVKLSDNYELTATSDHQIMTQRGYVPVSQVTKHDFFLIPRKVSINHGDMWNDDYFYIKVQTIQKKQYNGAVYSFEVDIDNSYCVNGGIWVKNCVGFGSGSAIDQRGAVQAYARAVWSGNNRWVGLVAKGHIYALSRIGHGGFGDGSTGSWMAETIAKHGIPFRSQKAGSYDFNDYDISLLRAWTRAGSVPQEVRDVASEYKGRAVLVANTEEARVALQRGFPIYICSQSSFRTTRDSRGMSPRTGRAWAHCMNVCAYIEELDAFIIINSWGPDKEYGGWIGGPVGFLEDLPQGAFICSRVDMEYILKQGDSYCIAELDTLVNLINWKDVITGFKGIKK